VTSNRTAPALLFALFGCGCAGSQSPLRVTDVSSGQAVTVVASGPNADFHGTYFSPQTGTLTLAQDGRSISGTYNDNQDGCEIHGTVTGSVSGALATLKWTESSTCTGAPPSWVDGVARLAFDPARPGDGIVRLLGQRSVRHDVFQVHHGEMHHFDRLKDATRWTAESLAHSPPLVSRGNGQLDETPVTSPQAMTTRLAIVRKALRDASEQASPSQTLVQDIADAEAALEQAESAGAAWQRGDGRYFLQVKYCLAPRLLRVEQELSLPGQAVPAGLSGVAPEHPPSNWDDSSCPSTGDPR